MTCDSNPAMGFFRSLSVSAALAGLLALPWLGCGGSDCEDGVDNDADGVIDLLDPGCAFNGDSESPDPPACFDEIDNDSDGFIDNNDPGCESQADDDETNAPIAACRDGVDNDSDGITDFPNDPGCILSVDDDESDSCPGGDSCPACGNGIDDDDDGIIDYPEETGCTSAGDNDEFNADPTICGGSVPVNLLPPDGIVEGSFMPNGQNNLISTDCAGTGTEVAFQFTLTETKSLVITTDFPETTTDTVLYVRTDCRMPATELGCNDDFGAAVSSRLEIDDLPAGEYFLIVDSNNAPGDYKVQLGEADDIPINVCDAESDALIPVSSAAMTGDTSTATNDLAATCGATGTSPDRVYQLDVLGELATLTVDTEGSAMDTVIDIRMDSCANAAIECDDDGGVGPGDSLISRTDVAPATYFIVVEGFFGASGPYNLNVLGSIKAGEACDPAAETAGHLVCAAGSCQGTAGMETCQ